MAILIASCATHIRKTNDIKLGMPKKKVIKMLGDPKNTQAGDGKTILMYELSDRSLKKGYLNAKTVDYAFIFDDQNLLISFGKKDEIPTERLIIRKEEQ